MSPFLFNKIQTEDNNIATGGGGGAARSYYGGGGYPVPPYTATAA